MNAVKKYIVALKNHISLSSVNKIIKADGELAEIWELSKKHYPDFKNHFANEVVSEEVEARIRLLVVKEVSFIKEVISNLLNVKPHVSYADVGDSDGSVQLILREFFQDSQLSSVGINMQKQAVKKIEQLGLDAIWADAIDLAKQDISYDVISLFETFEHLSDPIGFLNNIRGIVKENLVVSVPFVRKSRIGLGYLSDSWPEAIKPTIENQHIFELSPVDWTKLFLHSGWRVNSEIKLLMYPKKSLYRLVLEPYWRRISFDGFWFASLVKDETYSSKYGVE
jgi:hypothetical protein